MSSEAITRNDLTAILNEVLPPTPSEYRKLLWTNPSPTSAFAAQTISLDLSNYDAVDVEFRHWTNKDCRITTRNDLNEGEGVGIGISTNAASQGNYRRGFKMHTNGVQFWGGISNTSVDNNSTIPVRIWGIKYERVDPPQFDASDYVIEQGTSGIWEYRKWNSGVAECWGTWNGSISHYATALGGYAFYTQINYPTSLFISPPIHSYSAYVGGGFALTGTVTAAYADKVVPYAIASSSGTQTVYFYIHAIGKWK